MNCQGLGTNYPALWGSLSKGKEKHTVSFAPKYEAPARRVSAEQIAWPIETEPLTFEGGFEEDIRFTNTVTSMTVRRLIVDPAIASYFEIDRIAAGVETIYWIPGPGMMPATNFLEHNSPLLRARPFPLGNDLAIRLRKTTDLPVPFRATVIAVPRLMTEKTKPRVLSAAAQPRRASSGTIGSARAMKPRELPSGTSGVGAFSDDVNTTTLVWSALSTVSMAMSAYHGYKRNDSVGWALGWGLCGALFPVITPVIAVAQGFGERAAGR